MAIAAPIVITTNVDDLTDESEFLGEVVADEISPGERGPQLHLAVRPLTFAIGGKTGLFHEWYPISRAKRSKLGALVAGAAQVFGPKELLGQGRTVGKRAWFVRKDISFGRDRDTGEEIKSEGVLLFLRTMDPGDQAFIDTYEASKSASGAAPGAPAAAVAAPTDFTDEQIGLMLEAISGASVARLAVTVARTTLPAELKQALMSGDAVARMEADGLISTADGTVTPLVTIGTGDEATATDEADEAPVPTRKRATSPRFS